MQSYEVAKGSLLTQLLPSAQHAMNSDEERRASQTKQHAALRSDLAAALAAFDRAQDWADLIHDMQRVNRVLNKHPPTPFLPEKHLLAKRLAQCLTSFLPSGVHLKALETYHLVFTRIGPPRLARDLPLYAGGLFPLLSHCSTSLKPPLLSLYETHFLPLGTALCPVLDGLVLAILPGLEDESSEFYARSRKLLDSVAKAVLDVGVFARALWRALLISPPVRLAAAHYLRSSLSGGQEGLRAEMVSDMPLVAYAITSALSDQDALTQRSVLDLLLGELALDSTFFECETPEHLDAAVAVVGGVFGALIRRDMSLTKRVHAWLLGGTHARDAITFCNRYSKDFVLAAIDAEIDVSLSSSMSSPKEATRPIKIAAALMDREELRECLGHHFALRILRYGMQALGGRGSQHDREIRGAIADLVQDLGSARVFAELEDMLANGETKTHEDFELLTFALTMLPTKNDVVRQKHLSKLLQVAVQSLNAVSTDTRTLDKAVAFCSRAAVAMGLSRDFKDNAAVSENLKTTVSSFASFFVAWLAHIVEPAPVELRRAYSDVSPADEYTAEMRMSAVCESRKECVSLAKGACSFFVTVASSGIGGADIVQSSLQATAKCASTADVRISLAGAKGFAEVAKYVRGDVFTVAESDEQVLGVIRRCWRQMHPSLCTATPQSAQAFLVLQRRFPEPTRIVIADGILSKDLSRRLRNLERFACLWRLSVEHRLSPLPADDSLFLMLDALTDEDWGPKMLARSWLSDALEIDAASVLDAPLRLLLTTESRSIGPTHEFTAVYDAPRALYGFQALRAILESCPAVTGTSGEQGYVLTSPKRMSRKDGKRGHTGIRALATSAPTPRTSQALADVFSVEEVAAGEDAPNRTTPEGPVALSQLLPAHNYIITLALTCLGYLRGRVPVRFNRENSFAAVLDSGSQKSEPAKQLSSNTDYEDDLEWVLAGLGLKSYADLHDGVCAAAAECIATLLTAIPVPSQMSAVISNLFAEPVLTLVRERVGTPDPVLELHFLNAMSFLITADGPCYISSVQGKETFAKSDAVRVRISYSESQTQLQTVKEVEQASKGVQLGALESLEKFVPWLLDGVSSTWQTSREHANGSQEVLGVRRRWVQFIDTVIRHIGASLPVVVEGLLLVLCDLLEAQNIKVAEDVYSGDSELSRVDETLVLLEGLTVVTSNVLWSFEHALATDDLKDDVQVSSTSAHTDASEKSTTSVARETLSSSMSASKDAVSSESQNGPGAGGGSTAAISQMSTMSNSTSAMISAINPLRMINDFVKDVLSGSGSDGANKFFDPRRSGARVLFFFLPTVLENVATVWGPSTEAHLVENGNGIDRSSQERHGPPRLSTELPRERRQAQRTAVLAALEPVFQLRPTDVIAAVVSLYCKEQDEFGAMPEIHVSEIPSRMSSHILHALDYATPDVVAMSVKTIFEKATKWDRGSTEAAEGRAQTALRYRARAAIRKLVASGLSSLSDEDVESIGRMTLGGSSTSLAGGVVGLDLTQPVFPSVGKMTSSHQDPFHWGDLFAEYTPNAVETGCLNFLEHFLLTCSDGDDVQSAWPLLYPLFKDCLSSCRRKGTVPAALRVLGTFVAKNPAPFPERRYRREIMTSAVTVIASCASIASGLSDIPTEEQGVVKDFKKQLSIVALNALADAVPKLIDSTFLEDKPQLSSSVTASLSPAVSVLKKAAGRANSIQIALDSSKRRRGSVAEQSPRHRSESEIDGLASKAAADVLLQVSSRDWGVKLARRELVSLLDDANFFFGKENGVLERMSAVVREVVASGSAAYLLSSIGASSSNGTPGIPSLFVGRDSETVLRARAIRRIAFCVFVSEPDSYSPQLPTVLERIRDALRMADASLVAECLLCLRALLLRTGPTSISAFRATTLSEMFRIISSPTDDLKATVAALKFLDLITLLAPPDYGYERCFFFGEQPAKVGGDGTLEAFTPLASMLRLLWPGEKQDVEGIFMPPFRLEGGRTVLAGNAPRDLDGEFVGRYAAALQTRNSMAKMKAAKVDTETICRELEREFLM